MCNNCAICRYYQCIKIVDIFQYKNMYRLGPKQNLLNLVSDPDMHEECLSACIISHSPSTPFRNGTTIDSLKKSRSDSDSIMFSYQEHRHLGTDISNVPTIKDVLELYCAMKPGVRLKEILDPTMTRMNYKGLIVYGLLKGIIERVYEYPILIDRNVRTVERQTDGVNGHEQQDEEEDEEEDGNSESEDNTVEEIEIPAHILPYMDGRHCLDEICCLVGMSHQRLMSIFENNKSCRIIYM